MSKQAAVAGAALFGALHGAVAFYSLVTLSSGGETAGILLVIPVAITAAVPAYLLLRYRIILPLLGALYVHAAVYSELLFGYTMEPSIVIYLSPIVQSVLLGGMAVLAAAEYGVRARFGIFPPPPIV